MAFMQFHLYHTIDGLLCLVNELVERFLKRRIPQAIICKLRVFQRDRLLKVQRLPVKDKALERLMRVMERPCGRRLVYLPRLYADKPVLYHVAPAYAGVSGYLREFQNKRDTV